MLMFIARVDILVLVLVLILMLASYVSTRLYDTRGKGAIFRSKVRWTEEGEKPTKYLYLQEISRLK